MLLSLLLASAISIPLDLLPPVPSEPHVKSSVIKIHDDIDDDTLAKFTQDMDDHSEDPEIVIVIDSPGGSVIAAVEMVNIIRDSPRPTKCIVHGYAMSAAAYVLESCTKRVIEVGSCIMIHGPSSNKGGNMVEEENNLRTTQTFNEMIMEFIASKSKLTLEQLLADTKSGKELWFTSKKALEAGLVDEIK